MLQIIHEVAELLSQEDYFLLNFNCIIVVSFKVLLLVSLWEIIAHKTFLHFSGEDFHWTKTETAVVAETDSSFHCNQHIAMETKLSSEKKN